MTHCTYCRPNGNKHGEKKIECMKIIDMEINRKEFNVFLSPLSNMGIILLNLTKHLSNEFHGEFKYGNPR